MSKRPLSALSPETTTKTSLLQQPPNPNDDFRVPQIWNHKRPKSRPAPILIPPPAGNPSQVHFQIHPQIHPQKHPHLPPPTSHPHPHRKNRDQARDRDHPLTNSTSYWTHQTQALEAREHLMRARERALAPHYIDTAGSHASNWTQFAADDARLADAGFWALERARVRRSVDRRMLGVSEVCLEEVWERELNRGDRDLDLDLDSRGREWGGEGWEEGGPVPFRIDYDGRLLDSAPQKLKPYKLAVEGMSALPHDSIAAILRQAKTECPDAQRWIKEHEARKLAQQQGMVDGKTTGPAKKVDKQDLRKMVARKLLANGHEPAVDFPGVKSVIQDVPDVEGGSKMEMRARQLLQKDRVRSAHMVLNAMICDMRIE